MQNRRHKPDLPVNWQPDNQTAETYRAYLASVSLTFTDAEAEDLRHTAVTSLRNQPEPDRLGIRRRERQRTFFHLRVVALCPLALHHTTSGVGVRSLKNVA